jgi:hypothetical protein
VIAREENAVAVDGEDDRIALVGARHEHRGAAAGAGDPLHGERTGGAALEEVGAQRG